MAAGRRHTPRPFLKWAGGKAALAPLILRAIPEDAHAYHEPFVGGGAVFFALRSQRHHLPARLGDANPELIECYRVVRDQPEELLAALAYHEQLYLGQDEDGRAAYYYEQRAEEPASPVERAARFIFLNRTGYNGLYRVNSRGRFNVPHGRYRRPRIADRPRIAMASAELAGVELRTDDFGAACAAAERGDFVYLDPPYRPLSATARFTAYTAESFAVPDQERLAATFAELTERGVRAVLSNSDHPDIVSLYGDRGYHIARVPMARAINSKASARSPISELIVSNVPLGSAAGRRRT